MSPIQCWGPPRHPSGGLKKPFERRRQRRSATIIDHLVTGRMGFHRVGVCLLDLLGDKSDTRRAVTFVAIRIDILPVVEFADFVNVLFQIKIRKDAGQQIASNGTASNGTAAACFQAAEAEQQIPQRCGRLRVFDVLVGLRITDAGAIGPAELTQRVLVLIEALAEAGVDTGDAGGRLIRCTQIWRQ